MIETMELSDGVAAVSFEVIAHVTDCDYEWSSDAVLRRADGALFFVTDSGCSCYGFGENITTADLTPIQQFSQALALTSDREQLERSYRRGETEFR